MIYKSIPLLILALISLVAVDGFGQQFYFGADQSYVNEMEDCGVVYKENGTAKDVYDIYKDHGNNLVRLRLWHTPSWYDNLNEGRRYSDLADVKKAIKRAKDHGMNVLLDFHLSDNWADPSKQLVPNAWLGVVNNLPLLQDSLYNYISNTLNELNAANLTPEMVQIGNETNKGILLSPADNQVWTLNWSRNAALFNTGIKAVRDFSAAKNKPVKIMLHIADPKNAEWMAKAFKDNGVTDFDLIGLSYYWAWHKPTSIEDTKNVIIKLKGLYNKDVIIVETGYIWTTESNDNAGNIISAVHPDYSPASPENQRNWLIDLTKAVIEGGGIGVCYWEPSWVSSTCWNQWNQGSHQEHATFFDFSNNLLIPGGIQWMEYDYGLNSTSIPEIEDASISIIYNSDSKSIDINIDNFDRTKRYEYHIVDTTGIKIINGTIDTQNQNINLQDIGTKILFVQIYSNKRMIKSLKILTKI